MPRFLYMQNHMSNYLPTQTNTLPIKTKVKNLLWLGINKTIFRLTPSKGKLFRLFRVSLCRLFGADISYNASIHPSAILEYPWNIQIADFSSIGEKAWIYAIETISIGKYTNIGKDVYLITGTHDISSNTFSLITKSISIGNGCWVATRAMVLPGVSVGDFSVVGAGSVVTKSVPSHMVVGGNPAITIKRREIGKEKTC